MDLGDFHRAAFHDSSYSAVSICRAHNRVLQLPLRLQQAPTSQTFHTERLPRRPIAQRWSTIIYPFSDFILKDFPGGPSRGASQLILSTNSMLPSSIEVSIVLWAGKCLTPQSHTSVFFKLASKIKNSAERLCRLSSVTFLRLTWTLSEKSWTLLDAGKLSPAGGGH